MDYTIVLNESHLEIIRTVQFGIYIYIAIVYHSRVHIKTFSQLPCCCRSAFVPSDLFVYLVCTGLVIITSAGQTQLRL